MKLFTYRGKRVRVFHRKLKGITWFIWWFPFLLAISYYSYLHLEELKVHPLPQGYFLGAGGVPGRGEIPMIQISSLFLSDFP